MISTVARSHVSRARLWFLHLGASPAEGHAGGMQPTPNHSSDLDFSLVAMAVVMTLAIVFLVAQLV